MIIGQLFDHLVGERKKLVRHVKAERLGGPKVEYEFEFGGLNGRKIGRALALRIRATYKPTWREASVMLVPRDAEVDCA